MSKANVFRVVFWNIKHGGGSRAGKIAEQILEWKPDVIALAEFRGTPPSQSIAQDLHDAGFVHQLTTVNAEEPAWNALFLASRHAGSIVHVQGAPQPELYWLLAEVRTPFPFHIGVVHAPWSIYLGRLEYYAALLDVARDWQLGPGIIIGDINTGITGLDAETENSENYKTIFMNPMRELGWRDMYRAFHPNADAPTWFSRIRRGFRLDQAFVNFEMQPRVKACDYDWGKDAGPGDLSDHAALVLDISIDG